MGKAAQRILLAPATRATCTVFWFARGRRAICCPRAWAWGD